MSTLTRIALALVFVFPWMNARAAPSVGSPASLGSSSAADPAREATKVLVERGLFGAGDSLRLEQTFATADGGRIVRLRQLHLGVPVLGAMAVVRLDAAGGVLEVSHSIQRLDLGDVRPMITAPEAVVVARSAVTNAPLPADPASARTALTILPAAGGRLAWVVDLDTLVRVVAPTAIVDAKTGELVFLKNRALHVTRGEVFPSGIAARQSRRPDGSFDGTGRELAGLGGLTHTPGGHLTGQDIVTVNCCPTEDCDPTKGPRVLEGEVPFGFGKVTIRSVACDERPVATADANGDFLYDPAVEPAPWETVPAQADGDPFSEVMAYHYAQATLEWARTLDPEFQLGPKARPLHVVANLLMPKFDYHAMMTAKPGDTVTIDELERFANAAFIPTGPSDELSTLMPSFAHPYDTLVFGQGDTADFAYDPDVISHEFGHGIVGSVKGGLGEGSFVADEWGVLDAPGAMNEGIADAVAAFRANDPQVGEYVGMFELSGEGSLRDLSGPSSCPSILQGEVHQDSQHFSAALWAAREAVAGSNGADRLKFDQAFLAMIRSLLPTSSFDDAGLILMREVEQLFDPTAAARVEAAMLERGVIGCERYVDLVPGRLLGGYQLMARSPSRGLSPYTPGPVQFRLKVPRGAVSVRVRVDSWSLSGAKLRAIVREGARVVFRHHGGVRSDESESISFDRGDEALVASWEVEPSCDEREWFMALGNAADEDFGVSMLEVAYNVDDAKVEACRVPAHRTPVVEAPAEAGVRLAGGGGCGCGADGASLAGVLGLMAAVRSRRRSRA